MPFLWDIFFFSIWVFLLRTFTIHKTAYITGSITAISAYLREIFSKHYNTFMYLIGCTFVGQNQDFFNLMSTILFEKSLSDKKYFSGNI